MIKTNRKYLSVFVIGLSFFSIAATWNKTIYNDPVKVAKAFLEAIVNGENKKVNRYLVKRLHNNNHWVNATEKDRKEILTKWTPVEFRPAKNNFGYVIFKAPYGNIAVKFERKNNKWLWANE